DAAHGDGERAAANEQGHIDRKAMCTVAGGPDRALEPERRRGCLLRGDTSRGESGTHERGTQPASDHRASSVGGSTNFSSASATSASDTPRPTSAATRYSPPREPRSYRNA